MKEQSHKNEMRAALRGDFERLHARRENGGEAVRDRPHPAERGIEPPVAVAEPGRLSWFGRLRERF